MGALFSFHFENPAWLWLIPVIWLMGLLHEWKRGRDRYAAVMLPTHFGIKAYRTPWKSRLMRALPYLRLCALTLLLIAMARPQDAFSEEKVTTEGIDLVMALDVSTSMLARDFQPNRLEAAKKEAIAFAEGRQNDRIGLVIFAGESFTQCPVTIDHTILKNQINGIRNGRLEDGTAIGMGLATAVQRLKESESKSKVVILMTDGVNNKGIVDPATAAELALNYNIRVYTIGVGTNGRAYSPIGMYPNGEYVFDYVDVQIDEKMLKTLAQKTGGQYFRATDNKKLKGIYAEIDRLEKTRIKVSAIQRKTERYPVFAWAGLFLLLLEGLVVMTVLKKPV